MSISRRLSNVKSQAAPDRAAPSGPAPFLVEQDRAWALQLTELLATLEPLQRRLIDLRTAGRASEAIVATVKEFVSTLTSFAEQRFADQTENVTLHRLRGLATNVWDNCQTFLRTRPRSWGLLKRLFGTSTTGADRRDLSAVGISRRRVFAQLVGELFEVARGYFALFTSAYQLPSEAFSWTTASEVFLAQLKTFRLGD